MGEYGWEAASRIVKRGSGGSLARDEKEQKSLEAAGETAVERVRSAEKQEAACDSQAMQRVTHA